MVRSVFRVFCKLDPAERAATVVALHLEIGQANLLRHGRVLLSLTILDDLPVWHTIGVSEILLVAQLHHLGGL